MPDLITCAKGLTNGVMPMGAVLATKEIHDAFMTGPGAHDRAVPRLHLFGQPDRLRGRARHARDLRAKRAFSNARRIAPYWEDAVHSLKDCPHVIDIRNLGLIGGIELEPIAGEPTKRAFSAFLEAYEHNLLIRTTGDIIALSPPLIIEKGISTCCSTRCATSSRGCIETRHEVGA
jgi:beta-alanine--pyruvate transaminase